MGFQIEDGKGRSYIAEVTSKNQLSTVSENHSLQFKYSLQDGTVYQVIGDFAAVNNSTHTVLHLKNTSTTEKLAITYIRLQALGLTGGTALPDVGTYFQIGKGRTYSSGGTTVTPVNLNSTTGKTAVATVYDNSPTLAGTFTEIDRWYVKANGEMMTFNKEGSVILGQNNTFEIRIVSDHTAGTAYARISFVFVNGN